MGREAAESLHRPDAAATADAAAILTERSGCARLFPLGLRSGREAPRALIPPPPSLPRLSSVPHLSLRTHAARSTPRRGWLAALPFLFRPASPPSVHPLRALAHPAQPGSLSRPEGKREASAAAGGVRVSKRRWRRQRTGSSCAASPTATHFTGSEARRAPGHSCRPVPRPWASPFFPRAGSGNWCGFLWCPPSSALRLLGWGKQGVNWSAGPGLLRYSLSGARATPHGV